MQFLILFLSLLGWMLGIYRLGCRDSFTLPFNALSAIVLSLFFFGMVGALPSGIIVVESVCIFSALTLLIYGMIYKPTYWTELNVTPLLVFFTACIILAFKMQGTIFLSSDEFSHWGFVVKEMLRYQSLVTTEFSTLYKTYPPASSLLQYFFNTILGDHTEYGNLAIAIYIFSALFLLFNTYRWRQNKTVIILTLLFAYFSLFVLGNGLPSVLIDQLLSITAGCVLAYTLFNNDKSRYLLLSLACSMLVLEKSVGLLFAMVVALFTIYDTFVTRRKEWPYAFVPLLCLLVCTFAWKYYVSSHALSGTFSQYSTTDNLKHFFTGTLEPYQTSTLKHFFKALLVDRVGQSSRLITMPIWLILLSVFSFLNYRYPNPLSKQRQRTLFVFLLGGFVVYLIGLLSLYLFTFAEYDRSTLASFNRYIATYIYMWVIIVFTICARSENHRYRRAALLFWVILLIALAHSKSFRYLYQQPKITRMMEAPLAAYATEQLDKIHNASIFFIFQGSNGEENNLMRYYLYPNQVNVGCASIGTMLNAEDAWSCNLSAQEVQKMLASYDYVWVARGDSRLDTQYGSLFPKNAKGLYRIRHIKNNLIFQPMRSTNSENKQ